AERLAHVGDAGAQRLERRVDEAAKALERQREDWMSGVDSRIAGLEDDGRRRRAEVGFDGEAERVVRERRLHEVARRVDATAGARQPYEWKGRSPSSAGTRAGRASSSRSRARPTARASA